jgi:trigger factor
LKVTVTEPKSWQRVLEIEISADRVNEEINTAYEKYRQQAVLPGFRKGKVPMSLIKARYSDTIEQMTLQELIPKAWEDARQKNNIVPIAEPVVSDVNFKPGQPLTFKASVEVRPEIQLTDYTGFRAKKTEVTISEDDVQRSLHDLREHHATVAPSKDPVGETDIVIVDSWKVDQSGIPIVGQKTANHAIDLSSPHVAQEYKTALVGAAVGDQRRVTVTYPADLPQKELAGQEVSFLLKVTEIKKKTLPPLEDEFAKAVSNYSTLKSLKEGVRKSLQEQGEQRSKRDVEEQIIDQIIEKSPFEVPESMVAGYVEALVSDLQPGKRTGEDLDQLRKSFRPMAIRQIKRWFILQEVQKKEDIQVDKKELDARVTAMAEARGIKPKELHQLLVSSAQLEKLRHNMEEEKILGFLVSKARVETAPANSRK